MKKTTIALIIAFFAIIAMEIGFCIYAVDNVFEKLMPYKVQPSEEVDNQLTFGFGKLDEL